jgi:FkbM family methyltransferase
MIGGAAAAAFDLPTAIDVTLRRPAQIDVHAPLARALLTDGKPTGMRRWSHKAVQTLFHLVHQRLGRPARASLRPAGGARAFAVDCANTGFLDYARHCRHADGVEPEVTGLFCYLAPRVSVVYDIGANWGFYPLLFGTDPRFTGEVHAFEVRPKTAADLRHVVSAAGLAGRVSVHAHGLSDREGVARLEITRHSYLARLVGENHGRATEPVAVRRLDGLDLPPPQLIKLDVEGHEAAVLRGGAALLDRHRPLIVFESWHCPEEPERMLEPLRFLAALGYAFRRLAWQGYGAVAGAEQEGVVMLAPLTLDRRAAFAQTLQLLAYHPARAAAYFRPAGRL